MATIQKLNIRESTRGEPISLFTEIDELITFVKNFSLSDAPVEHEEFLQNISRKPAAEMVKPAPSSEVVNIDFPPLPIAKPIATLREVSPAPSCVSSGSEESVCSTRPGRILTLNELLRFNKNFKIKLTLQKATTCFHWCDDRTNNIEHELYAGLEVVVNDVLEFPHLGENWYHIVNPFFGWVHGDAFKKAREEVQEPKRKMKVVAEKVVSKAEKFPFLFGESVKCLVNSAWKVGTIQTTSRRFVKVLFNGEKSATIVDISDIKKIESKQNFIVVVKDLPVRTQPDVRSFATAHLKEGTKIQVVEFRGQFAKINNPVGWVRARNELQCSILESNYVPEKVLPTLRITNLPEDAQANSVFKCIKTQLGPCHFAGVRINFTASRNGKKQASMVFPQSESRYEAVPIVKHSVERGFSLGGERLNIFFMPNYMKKYSCPKNWCPEREI